MQPTRRTWTAAAIGVTLAVFAPIVGSVVPAVGAALVLGWLVALQSVAVDRFRTTVDSTTISVEPSVTGAQVDTDIPVLLTVERPPAAAETTLTVSLSMPAAARSVPKKDRQVTLAVGETQATTSLLLSVPIASRISFSEPTWELVDSHTAFTETFDRGPTPTVTFAAQTLRNLHVGRGGSELSAFGQHPTDKTGDGLTPTELRQYIGGEPADRIDWKATARLSDAYVREFQTESDRELTLIIDHRSQMGAGSTDNSMLAYVREVALTLVGTAETEGDPLRLITVGDDGLTKTVDATRQPSGYAQIREQLLSLEPTPAGPPSSSVDLKHPDTTRRLAQQLTGDNSAFATKLRQFTATAPSYTQRIESDPLYGAVDYLQATTTATGLTIILTTDTNRPWLRETVQAAARDGNSVLVFLTPQVLFNAGELSDIDRAYSRYYDFEQFRTELEEFGPVVAYEVGPGDRLARLLSARRKDTASRRTASGGVQ